MIRPYATGNPDATLTLFLAAVTVTAASDYSAAQVAAWAGPAERHTADWDRRMATRESLVAVRDHEVAGFSDVSDDGYIDMMFVSPTHARQGVATALMAAVEARARILGVHRLWANVSITARPLFEACGFAVDAEQHPVIGGVALTNYRMSRALS